MIYEHFRATGARDAAQGLSDLFNVRLQSDDVQDFDTRWDQALLPAKKKKLQKWSWKVCTRQNYKILISFRRQWPV